MYIKCDNVEQLDEVKNYYNNLESYISAVNMFKWYDNKEPICISENGDFGRLSYVKTLNITIVTYNEWKENIINEIMFKNDVPTLNLRQLAESNITFRLETEEDVKEVLELTDLKQNESLLEFSYITLNKDYTFTFYNKDYEHNPYYPTWTEIKERYVEVKITNQAIIPLLQSIEKPNTKLKELYSEQEVIVDKIDTVRHFCNRKLIEELTEKLIENMKHVEIELMRLNILEKLPYIEPTESEICERIKFENDKVDYSQDWNDGVELV